MSTTELVPPLSVVPFTLTFPDSFQFTLNIPPEITVRELTELTASYSALHKAHGPSTPRPMHLTSMSGDVVVDLFMLEGGDRAIGEVGCYDLRVGYMGEGAGWGVRGVRRWEGGGAYLVQERTSGQLRRLVRFDKGSLTFRGLQALIQRRDYYIRLNRERNNHFVQITSCFETSQSLCVVSRLQPFQLSRLKVQNRFLMNSIISQVARIVHIMERDGTLLQHLQLEQFEMSFELRVVYCGFRIVEDKLSEGKEILVQECNQSRGKQAVNFTTCMTKLLESIFKNCGVRLLENYIPLFHWFKNGRISNYIEFLKYFDPMPDPHHDRKTRQALGELLKAYISDKLQSAHPNEEQQLAQNYNPKTPIFVYSPERKPVPKTVVIEHAPRAKIIDQVTQDMSTVKKKKPAQKQRPIYLARQMHKLNKKSQPRNKSEAHSCIYNSKSTKTKKHKRRISEFLIDD